MNYSEMTNQELEEANQELMRARADIKAEQQEITKVLDERITRGFDLKVKRTFYGRRSTEVVWDERPPAQTIVQPEGFEVPK